MRRVAGLDWRFALLLAVCFVLAAMAVTRSRSLPAEHKGPRVQAEQKAEGGLKGEKPAESAGQAPGDRPPGAGQVAPGAPSGEGKDQAKQGNDEGTEIWPSIFGLKLKITDSLIVILTALLAIYTRELNRSTLKLWEAGERQIKVAETNAAAARESADAALKGAIAAERSAEIARDTLIAGNRAWLRVQIRLGDQPLMYSAQGMDCGFVVSAYNVGKEPALHVNTHIWMVPWKTDPGYSIQSVLRERCEQARKTGGWRNYTMFPGESLQDASGLPPMQEGVRIPVDEVEAGLKAGTDGEGRPILGVFVGGCVSYSFPSDPGNRHLAPFLFELERPGNAIRIADCPIPPQQLRLSALISGGLGNPD